MVYGKIAVGEPYEEGIKALPEQVAFTFNSSGGLLLYIFHNPTPAEIKDVKKGNIKLGILEKAGQMYILSKFGDLRWEDASFHVRLTKPFRIEGIEHDNEGYLLQIVLIDASNGIVKVIRAVSMPNNMSKILYQLIEKQKENSTEEYDIGVHNQIVSQIYANFSTVDLVREAKEAHQIFDLNDDKKKREKRV